MKAGNVILTLRDLVGWAEPLSPPYRSRKNNVQYMSNITREPIIPSMETSKSNNSLSTHLRRRAHS